MILAEKFERESLYVLLKEKMTDDEAVRDKGRGNRRDLYRTRKKCGIIRREPWRRSWPVLSTMTAMGRYGLEEYYDEELAEGKSIVLNIDYNIQYHAEQMLAEASCKLEAIAGRSDRCRSEYRRDAGNGQNARISIPTITKNMPKKISRFSKTIPARRCLSPVRFSRRSPWLGA